MPSTTDMRCSEKRATVTCSHCMDLYVPTHCEMNTWGKAGAGAGARRCVCCFA
jgi:hypothetical protein